MMNMTRLTFVRHTESEMNRTRELIGGRSNHTPATAEGLFRAALLGSHFREAGIRFDAVYSSGAVRADQTARAIVDAAGYDLPILIDERLQEVSQGGWEGRLRDDVYTDDMIRRHRLNDIDGCLPGAESVAAAQVRAGAFVRDTEIWHPDERLLVVSHGLLIRSLHGSIHRRSKDQILAADTPNLSVTDVSVQGGIILSGPVGKTLIDGYN